MASVPPSSAPWPRRTVGRSSPATFTRGGLTTAFSPRPSEARGKPRGRGEELEGVTDEFSVFHAGALVLPARGSDGLPDAGRRGLRGAGGRVREGHLQW